MTKAKTETDGAQNAILEGLNNEQKQAVVHGKGPLLIVAGAGTGKTAVITRRIAYLIAQGVRPEAILALAFGEKAAAEMEERVDQLLPYGYNNLQISTFHAFGELVLREHGLEIGLPDFKVLDEVGQWLLIKNHLDEIELDYYRPLGNSTRFIKALVSHFSRAKDELVTPEAYLEYAEKLRLAEDKAEAGLENAAAEGARITEVANAYHRYQKLLLDNSSLDFGDLINYTLELFRKRPKILALYRERFKYILVDEFQDTNLAQYELLKLLSQPKNNLTVVGDDDQSIFKFRGASISNILHFQKDFPKAVFVSLTANYRSGQKILDAAHRFICQNDPERLEVRLHVSKLLVNQTSPGGEIAAAASPDYVAEARDVGRTILKIREENPDVNWNDFAILGRSHDLLESFVNVFDENHFPYIYFANRGLYKKRVILDVLAYFRLLDNYHESPALYRVLNFPIFKIKHSTIVNLTQYARRKTVSLYEALREAAALKGLDSLDIAGVKKVVDFLDKHTASARQKSCEQVFIEVVNDLDLVAEAMRDYEVAKYLEAFRHRIQNFQNDNADKSLKHFVRELSFEQEAGAEGELEMDIEAGPDSIKLMTVHASKGLEFRFVFVVGLVDKRFPSIERKDPIELPRDLVNEVLPEGDVHLQEERRLFYVAMTRAKERLYLTRALNYGGKFIKRPSRFLVEIGLAEDTKPREATGEIFFKGQSRKRGELPLPKEFSFTQISAFRKCPLQYKYVHILKLPVPSTGQVSLGQTIHLVLEKYLKFYLGSGAKQDLFGGKAKQSLPDYHFLETLYEQNWIDDWYADKKEKENFRQLGREMLKIFYEECRAAAPQPKYLEQAFRLKLGKYLFAGKIDRADIRPEGLLIIDYKTGKMGALGKVNKDQLLIYQWAAQEQFSEKLGNLQYWYLKDKLEKQSFLGTAEEIVQLKSSLQKTVEEIIETVRNDDFYARDSQTRHDKPCEYRKYEM